MNFYRIFNEFLTNFQETATPRCPPAITNRRVWDYLLYFVPWSFAALSVILSITFWIKDYSGDPCRAKSGAEFRVTFLREGLLCTFLVGVINAIFEFLTVSSKRAIVSKKLAEAFLFIFPLVSASVAALFAASDKCYGNMPSRLGHRPVWSPMWNQSPSLAV